MLENFTFDLHKFNILFFYVTLLTTFQNNFFVNFSIDNKFIPKLVSSVKTAQGILNDVGQSNLSLFIEVSISGLVNAIKFLGETLSFFSHLQSIFVVLYGRHVHTATIPLTGNNGKP